MNLLSSKLFLCLGFCYSSHIQKGQTLFVVFTFQLHLVVFRGGLKNRGCFYFVVSCWDIKPSSSYKTETVKYRRGLQKRKVGDFSFFESLNWGELIMVKVVF